MDAPVIQVLESPDAVAREAARRIIDLAAGRDRFRLVLAGGATPRALYRLLATEFRGAIDWPRVDVFFGDERCVPPDHDQSNYGMAAHALLTQVNAGSVHRIEAEAGPSIAADRYEALLRTLDPPDPLFDVVLLGMGADGHTLSLFPGFDPRTHAGRLVVHAVAGPGYVIRDRVTLTPEAVARSRVAIFMVTGADKAPALRRVLEGSETAPPAALVRARERTCWLVDRAADPHAHA